MMNNICLDEVLQKLKDRKYLNYMIQFNENLDTSNYLKTWMEYKFPDVAKCRNSGADLDVSQLAIVSYCIELALMKNNTDNFFENIENQEEILKYQIRLDDSLQIRGDWLTSPLHIIKLYMGLLWESEKEIKNINRREFVNLFDKTTPKHLLYAPTGTWVKYCYKNANVIWKAFDPDAQDFLQNVVKAGNFIAMPKYINPCRCKNFGGDDTLDTLMWKMYCCFSLQGNKVELNKYLESAICGRNENESNEARENIFKWMCLFNYSWNDFIKYNYLSEAVSFDGVNYGRPLDLRTGKEINLRIGSEYDPLPRSVKECTIMMKNYNCIVEKRTESIFNCVSQI